MNTKQTAIYGGGFLVSFLVMLGAMYVIYPYLHPDEAQQADSQIVDTTGREFDPDFYTPAQVDTLNRRMSSLQDSLQALRSGSSRYEATIDSLEGLIAELQASAGSQEDSDSESPPENAGETSAQNTGGGLQNADDQNTGAQNAGAQNAGMQDNPFAMAAGPQTTEADAEAANLEEISKSLLRMDEEALAPILDLLDDDQLVQLYKSSSNMQRQKLLQSLEPKKAADLLKKVMS
ncbi:MAG: hypothetical protein U5K31_09095 [Balneolaceae bacterium]|nr:hypothetical protein [Balneolaceae bacterium]